MKHNEICTAVSLDALPDGAGGKVISIAAEDGMRKRLMDIGLLEDAVIRRVGRSPAGGLCAYEIRGAVIAIRDGDCRGIRVHPCEETEGKM